MRRVNARGGTRRMTHAARAATSARKAATCHPVRWQALIAAPAVEKSTALASTWKRADIIGGPGVSPAREGARTVVMKSPSILSAAALAAITVTAAAAAPAAKEARTLTFTTPSEEAKTQIRELQRRVENFQGGPASAELAKKI